MSRLSHGCAVLIGQDRMLFAFHKSQNAKKPGSCHATYIVCGYRPPPVVEAPTEEDTFMMSSPFEGSMPATNPDITRNEITSTMEVVLAPEEELQAVRDGFVQVTSIHVYSLEPAPLH